MHECKTQSLVLPKLSQRVFCRETKRTTNAIPVKYCYSELEKYKYWNNFSLIEFNSELCLSEHSHTSR